MVMCLLRWNYDVTWPMPPSCHNYQYPSIFIYQIFAQFSVDVRMIESRFSRLDYSWWWHSTYYNFSDSRLFLPRQASSETISAFNSSYQTTSRYLVVFNPYVKLDAYRVLTYLTYLLNRVLSGCQYPTIVLYLHYCICESLWNIFHAEK